MYSFDDTASVPLTQSEVMELVAAAQARRSKIIALLVALGAHLLLVGALLFIVFGEVFVREPSLIISAPYSPVEQLRPTKKDLVQVKAERPAAPSASMSKVVVAETLSHIPLPVVDDFVENPVNLGTGFGEGFGEGLGGLGGAGLGGSFFGTPAVGKSVILVIDVSTSMPRNCGDRGIEAIRSEIARTINAFRPGSRFNIVCFGNMADAFRELPVAATSTNKAAAIEFTKAYFTGAFTRTRTADGIDAEKPIPYIPIRPNDFKATANTSGGSRYDLALIAAFEQQPETIFLLTDGEPSTRRDGQSLSKNEILSMVRKAGKQSAGGRRMVVNGISVNGIGEDYLKDIARAFRGSVKVIEPKNL